MKPLFLVLLHVSLLVLMFHGIYASWHGNIFHQLIHNISQVANVTKCWVCSYGPSSSLQGWPVMPGGTLSLTGWNSITVYGSLQNSPRLLKDPGQFILSRRGDPPPAPLCVRRWNTSHEGYYIISQGGQSQQIPMSRISLGDYPNCKEIFEIPESPQACPGRYPNISFPFSCSDTFIELYGNKRRQSPLNKLQEEASLHNGQWIHGLPSGMYWLCGYWAGKALPPVWNGICTIGTLTPGGIQFYPLHQPIEAWDRQFEWHRLKRAYDESYGYDPDNTHLEGERLRAIMFPMVEVALNIHQIRRLSAQLEILANGTTQGINALQTEVDSLAGVLAQHKLALDYLLSKGGGLCFWLNTTCCHFINESGYIEEDVDKLHKVVDDIRKTYSLRSEDWWSWLTNWLPENGWVKSIFIMFILFTCVALCFCCFQRVRIFYNSLLNMKPVELPRRVDVVKETQLLVQGYGMG